MAMVISALPGGICAGAIPEQASIAGISAIAFFVLALADRSRGRGFDRLSKVYDLLVALVYGRALRKAQTCFLDRVKPGSRVLVVGGGTGWFLEALLQTEKVGLVTYVELSRGMLEKSRQRITERLPEMLSKVEWVEGTVHDLPEEPAFDLVCTHCFLDLFEGKGLEREVMALQSRMERSGSWYFSDFRYVDKWPMSWISRVMIWGMYRFFRWTCGIQARRLPDFEDVFSRANLQVVERQLWYGGMISSKWYARNWIGKISSVN